jgi:hypothetical protein
VPPPDRSLPNVAQLKQDIDSGFTGDKQPMFDPALAPLGTDDEAAGTPPTPEEVAAARALERAPFRSPRHPFDRPEDRHGRRLLGLIAGLVALALAALSFSFGAYQS